MGFSTPLLTVHNDDLHYGNAKRNIAGGLAGLNAALKVFNALSPLVLPTPSVNDFSNEPNARDGDISTYAVRNMNNFTGTLTQDIIYDLTSLRNIVVSAIIELSAYRNGGNASGTVYLQLSRDGTTWFSHTDSVSRASPGTTWKYVFLNVAARARYIRLRHDAWSDTVSAGNGSECRIQEITVYEAIS